MDDVAEHGFGGGELPAPRKIACKPCFRIEQNGAARVVRVEQIDRIAVELVRIRPIARFLGNCAEVAENLRAHPQDRGDLAAPNGL